MSIYQSKCERFICSPIASGLTAILSVAYFVSNPTLSSLFLTTIVVRCVDLLQKRLLKYDLERFKNFARPVVEEEQQEEQEEKEEQEEQTADEGSPEADDEGDYRFTDEDDEGDPFKEAVFCDY